MIRLSALLAALLLASPALSNPATAPLPTGPVSLDAFKGWVAVPVAVMANGQMFTHWMLVPAQAAATMTASAETKLVTAPTHMEAASPAASALPAEAAASAGATHARMLAATCAACHGTEGRSHSAIPGLAGMDKAYFIKQMHAFKDGTRKATVMHQHAKAYTDEEIEHMAAIFAATKP